MCSVFGFEFVSKDSAKSVQFYNHHWTFCNLFRKHKEIQGIQSIRIIQWGSKAFRSDAMIGCGMCAIARVWMDEWRWMGLVCPLSSYASHRFHFRVPSSLVRCLCDVSMGACTKGWNSVRNWVCCWGTGAEEVVLGWIAHRPLIHIIPNRNITHHFLQGRGAYMCPFLYPLYYMFPFLYRSVDRNSIHDQ